jgi:hypothetical protein
MLTEALNRLKAKDTQKAVVTAWLSNHQGLAVIPEKVQKTVWLWPRLGVGYFHNEDDH